ncbi:single-stranded-DNA-specific exonuclease RecJ [Stomatobaculum longum]|uniref:Single-stranded-DNA-specific exonuclease RecJ n=1 Tax=Stomatobaculum longum TaxID=796942 RepID=A0AA36Y6S7_9FIRM|nr:single-stranded-DNA-specific exonuclease RecJ [Stomatobaculum longum]EHO18205.1 single-stranded-DNA-specific exonuclease RecJ [Stomatobaculum longum]
MRETRWKIYSKRADFGAISTRFSVSPMLARILINRGVAEEEIGEYLSGTLDDIPRGVLLPDMAESVRILAEKIQSRAPIRIIGDYDIDGVCSTYILVQGLRALGAAADYDIPDRIADGYGLNLRLVERAVADGIDTIVTCDNGIAARQEVAAAADAGLTVIVTDHHEVAHGEDGAELLPPADTVVDPKREGSQYPFASICGAVVAWKLIEELFLFFGKRREEARVFLPFAAIATVGDVMPLKKENRIIVREGLKAIGSCDNLGLRKLIARCGLDSEALSAYHIGFVIGPCLNAGGRLESAKLGLSMLLETGEESAEAAAERLKALNDRRKQMTEEGIRAASAEIDALPELPKVLVVYLKDCHESVAGIIAGRLKEKYYRPSFVLTDSQEAGFLKGSGRSIEGYHMFRALEEVAPLLTKFGGHPMAAGLTLPETELTSFREELNRNAVLSDEQLTETQWIDIALPFAYANEELVTELSRMEPFGQGNARPCFGQKNVGIRAARVLGKNRNVVKLSLQDEAGTVREALAFTDGDAFLAEMEGSRSIAVLYYPEINEYMGRRNLQLVLKAWKFAR